MSISPDETIEARELPSLQQATLSREELRGLIADIKAHSVLLGVNVRRSSARYADRGSVELDMAMEGLWQGEVGGVQIRYVHEGVQWWDTLLLLPDGLVRLTRIEAPVL